MIKRYLVKRDNPWEVLALASLIFISGIALLLQKGPFVQISSAGRARVRATAFPASVAHGAGVVAIVFALLLVALYIYALRTSPRQVRRHS
jgi:TRAP-type C4-dicarboxylate transport system permease small subunit